MVFLCFPDLWNDIAFPAGASGSTEQRQGMELCGRPGFCSLASQLGGVPLGLGVESRAAPNCALDWFGMLWYVMVCYGIYLMLFSVVWYCLRMAKAAKLWRRVVFVSPSCLDLDPRAMALWDHPLVQHAFTLATRYWQHRKCRRSWNVLWSCVAFNLGMIWYV